MNSKKCPACHRELRRESAPAGLVFACPNCGGRALNFTVLRKAGAGREFLSSAVAAGEAVGGAGPGPCPHCGRDMDRVAVRAEGESVDLGVCRPCQTVWMDAAAFESVVRESAGQHGGSDMTGEVAEGRWKQLAQSRLDQLEKRQKGGSRSGWEIVLGFLSFLFVPQEQEAPVSCDRPWATWGLLAACAVATVAWLSACRFPLPIDQECLKWGFIPAEWFRWGGVTLISSFLLHVGAVHLLLNGYFLYLFGGTVEALLGSAGLLGLAFGAHGAGMLLHSLFYADPTVPTVGASAGVFGVLAFYTVNFPRARLIFALPFASRLKRLRVPAVVLLVVYGALQVLGLYLQGDRPAGVAYWGHLGGAAMGLVSAVLYRAIRAAGRTRSATD